MPWGALITAGVTYAASENQKEGAQDAANAAAGGAQAGFDQYKQYNQPFYDAGTSALSRLERLNAGDFSAFTQSPDYQFALNQGIEGINRGASARGALNSGGTDVDLLKYGQGLASQNYGQLYSRLADLAGMGQASAQGIGGAAVNAQNRIGDAQAGGIIGGANATSNLLSGLGGLAGQYYGQGFNNRQSTFGSGNGAFMPGAQQQFPTGTQPYQGGGAFTPGYNFNFGP